MLHCANEMPRSFCEVSIEQSYLSEGHMCLCGWFKGPHCILSFWVSLNREPLSRGDGLRYFPRSSTWSWTSSLLSLWRLTQVLHGQWGPPHHLEEATSVKTKKSSLKANSERILLCFTSHSEPLVGFCLAMQHILAGLYRMNRLMRSSNLPPPRILGYGDLLKLMQHSLTENAYWDYVFCSACFGGRARLDSSLTIFIWCPFLPALCLSYPPLSPVICCIASMA